MTSSSHGIIATPYVTGLLKLARSAKSARSVAELLRPTTIPGTCGAFWLFNKAGRGMPGPDGRKSADLRRAGLGSDNGSDFRWGDATFTGRAPYDPPDPIGRLSY
jgi:hypothetical protein